MKKILFVAMLVFVFAACGGGDDAQMNNGNAFDDKSDKEAPEQSEENDSEEQENNAPEPAPQPEPEPDPQESFDPENPGWTVEFNIIDTEMMGQGQSLAIGYFMRGAREDLEPETAADAALDTCVMGESSPRVPTCTSKEDCAPEQECVPDYDNNSGQPIENSEHCETPDRDSIDVGPVVIAGFNGGPYTFAYEPGDKVYKLNGTGDGSIDRSIIAYGAEYTITGENMLPEDLQSLSATFRMPPALSLIEPVMTEGGMFGAAVEIDTTKPITFKWEGNGGQGYIDITIMGAQNIMSPVSVSCKVIDDGEFTVPAEFASQLVFGTGQMVQMMNMITMDRHSEARITGEGITSGKVSSEQLVMISVVPVGGN